MKDGIHPDGYTVTNKQTNADRIRSMTDEELAEFLFDFKNDFVKPNEDMTYEEWLQAENEENDGNTV